LLQLADDDVYSDSEGQYLAAGIPGAQFIELDSKNHIVLDAEPAWERFCGEVLDFMGLKGRVAAEDPAFSLTIPARARSAGADYRSLGNWRLRSAFFDQRKDGTQSRLHLFDKLGVLDPRPGDLFAHDRGFDPISRARAGIRTPNQQIMRRVERHQQDETKRDVAVLTESAAVKVVTLAGLTTRSRHNRAIRAS